jgi:hypothetical protein
VDYLVWTKEAARMINELQRVTSNDTRVRHIDLEIAGGASLVTKAKVATTGICVAEGVPM